MEEAVQVAKWGNSLAVRLPAKLVRTLDLKVGDTLDLKVLGDRELGVEKRPELEELLTRVRKYRGRMPADYRFDRLEANDQE
jgi:antitoxin MazE